MFRDCLLPPANEVWGKVIFLQACVKKSVQRGGAWSGGSGPRGVCSLGVRGPRGVPAPGGSGLGRCLVETPPMATAVGGTHPTGMHSCPI